ncbi:MAG: Hsp20/alpha crystallin family protein [Ignavibacteriales bacterium]|nr:Hsp20/alpha crystallin family protein [Ignavibacteriales bacterium]
MLVRIAGFDPLFNVDRAVENVFSGLFPFRASGVPAMDIAENDGEYAIVAELPGVKKEDVKISVENGNLILRGERKHYGLVEGTRVLRHETNTNPFVRTFELPEAVDVNQISAEMKDGILTIRLPKMEQSRPRQISIR